jgi:hypothetical protein
MNLTPLLVGLTVSCAGGAPAWLWVSDFGALAGIPHSKDAQAGQKGLASGHKKKGRKAKDALASRTRVTLPSANAKPQPAALVYGRTTFATPSRQDASPEREAAVLAALEEADKGLDNARALIAAGREREAIDVLNAAKSKYDSSAAAGGGRDFDTVAIDAYIFLHRDDDARRMLASPRWSKGAWSGAVPRQGLLLALHGKLRESMSLDPAHYAVRYWSGYGQDAFRALPDPATPSGLIAAWCLAVGNEEKVGNNWAMAGRYYKMGLDAAPGNPLLSLSYGLIVRSQNHLAESIPYIETAARQLTGSLKDLADNEIREIHETLAKRNAAAAAASAGAAK